jgi:plasmid stabilization system protein ParE
MDVQWTNTAASHLDSIYAYIARDSERYALRTVDRITQRSIQIAEYPLSGRMVPEISIEQIREVIEGCPTSGLSLSKRRGGKIWMCR